MKQSVARFQQNLWDDAQHASQQNIVHKKTRQALAMKAEVFCAYVLSALNADAVLCMCSNYIECAKNIMFYISADTKNVSDMPKQLTSQKEIANYCWAYL